MKYCFYKLNEIPDLTLAKYQSLGENGIEAVLLKHGSFLRQWQGLSEMCNIQIHIIYLYEPSKTAGNKFEVYLGYTYGEKIMDSQIENIMKVTPLSDYFQFIKIEQDELSKLKSLKFNSQAIMKKCERKKITEDDSNLTLFTVEGYETNENARLYDMLRVMESLNERAAYYITLQGVDAYIKAAKALEKPISVLRKRAYGVDDSIVLKPNKEHKGPRDTAIENTLKNYEDFLEKTSNSPCFKANVKALADNELTAKIILNSACGESIEKGNCLILSEGINSVRLLDEKNDIREYAEVVPNSLRFWPTTFSLEEISPFFRFPVLYDGEHIELKKETKPNLKAEGIYLGDTTEKYKTFINTKALMKHAFVCGVPGAGKTNTMLHIANSLWHNKEIRFGELIERKIPFLVLEPAKREYRELSLFDIPELIVFSPSANTRFPLQINPFEFPIGLTLSEHINMLKQVFEGAFPMQSPAPFILDQAIEKIYQNKGWNTNDINTGEKQYPRMSELYDEFKNQLENTTYDGEIRGNIQSVLEMRIGSLLRREKKDIFDVDKSILTPEEWMKYPIVMELESLGKETANFITLLLCTLIRETLKVNPMDGVESSVNEQGEIIDYWKPLRHVIFIEEAHNLIATQNEMESCQDSNPKIAATECIVDMLKEVRALREGIIIADQLPTAMSMDVIKNTNVKIVHRLLSGDDRGLVGSTMAASEFQLERIATYLPGQALITYEGLLRPFEIRVCNLEGHGLETPNDIQLYELMNQKEGQRKIFNRFECRAWANLQHKVNVAMNLELEHRKSLRKYEFEGKTPLQKEDFFEQCLLRFQALELMKQSYIMETCRLTKHYIDNEIVDKTISLINTIGTEYKNEVIFLIEKNM